MTRLVIITHSYAPENTPRAFRWAAVAEALAGQGYEVHVVTGSFGGPTQGDQAGPVTVWRATGLAEKLRSRLGRTEPLAKARGTPAVAKRRSLMKVAHDLTWKKLYWPDYACLWVSAAASKAAELILPERKVVLISVSDPYSGHLAALRVRRRHPNVPWLADIGDPFSFAVSQRQNNARLYGARNRRLETSVVTQAGAVSVTTEATRRALLDLVPAAFGRVTVIPPLLTSTTTTGEIPKMKSATKATRLICIGTLYRQMRNPTPLLRLFEAAFGSHCADSIELHLVGEMNDCVDIAREFRRRLGERLHIHGLVSRGHAQELMSAATLLVNLGNHSPYQLPSKVVEYAATGKPVIHLSSHPKDCCLAFFENYRAARVFTVLDNPTPTDVERFRRLVQDPPKSLTPAEIDRFLSPYRLEPVVAQYRQLIDGLALGLQTSRH